MCLFGCIVSSALQSTFPELFSHLDIKNTSLWEGFAKSPHCEQDFPRDLAKKVSLFQQVRSGI